MSKPSANILVDLSDILEQNSRTILVKLQDNRVRRLPLYYKDGTDILCFVPGGVFLPPWLYRKVIDPYEKEINPNPL